MRNPFKNNHLTIDELVQWKANPFVNPKTGKSIKANGGTYQIIDSVYKKYKSQVDEIVNNKVASQVVNSVHDVNINVKSNTITQVVDTEQLKANILNSIDDRDPISMNIFWKETAGIKQVEYSEENFSQLIFYTDTKNLLRCLEKETLSYLKTYNLRTHPITSEPIPDSLFDDLEIVDLVKMEESKTISDVALDVFQYFGKISIFIDYEWFMELSKDNLIKFNYELKDFWLQNVPDHQKHLVSDSPILSKSKDDLEDKDIEEIQRYLLNEMKTMLQCEKEEVKYMVNYIILGALGIVIPKIKELYPDFVFAF
jgi:hypothetical protein